MPHLPPQTSARAGVATPYTAEIDLFFSSAVAAKKPKVVTVADPNVSYGD
jgi:hypothetical protein